MPRKQTDPALILSARNGNPGAWDTLIAEWLPEVLGWCARMGGPKVDAEDAAHDVFIVAIEKIGALKDPERFPSWMLGITRRVLAGHRRKAWVKRWVPGITPDVADTSVRGRWPQLADDTRLVQRALDQLPAKQREVVVLCDLEERTTIEVAGLLEVAEGTIKSRLRRGRQALREALTGLGYHPTRLDVIEGGKS